jgi:hypothetical protein
LYGKTATAYGIEKHEGLDVFFSDRIGVKYTFGPLKLGRVHNAPKVKSEALSSVHNVAIYFAAHGHFDFGKSDILYAS